MFYDYILYSETHDRYYIGQTQNHEERLIRHNSLREKSTAPFAPWKLVLTLQKNSRGESIILERKIKNLNRSRLLQFIEKYK